MTPNQHKQIRRSIALRSCGVKTGDRKIYWVSYPSLNGEICREVYLSFKEAYERANEIAYRIKREPHVKTGQKG